MIYANIDDHFPISAFPFPFPPFPLARAPERLTEFKLQGGSDVDLNGASARGIDLCRNLITYRHSTACGVQARWR